eukprot:363330-Chlamydomonas_euryale.AAC.13
MTQLREQERQTPVQRAGFPATAWASSLKLQGRDSLVLRGERSLLLCGLQGALGWGTLGVEHVRHCRKSCLGCP